MQISQNFDEIDGDLDGTETEGLIYMREEEKLAHDVYLTLYQQWGLAIFNNIAKSEERHESQMENLLNRYQIADPVGNNPIGVFVNPDLQKLYHDLVAQGRQSLTEALKVGVLIEETDIADLQQRVTQTDQTDIQRVYQKLLSGSNHHLSAFTANLTGEINPTYSSNNSGNQTQENITDDILTGGGNQQQGGRNRLRGNLRDNSQNGTDFLLNLSSRIPHQLGILQTQMTNFDSNLITQNQSINSGNLGSPLYKHDWLMGTPQQNGNNPLTIVPTNP